MQNQENEKIKPEDFIPESSDAIDAFAITEINRKKEQDILKRIYEGGYGNQELEDVDIDLITKEALKLINGAEFDTGAIPKEDHNDLALKLLSYDEKDLLIHNLPHFHDLNKEVALQLIKQNRSHDVLENLDCFKEEDHQEIIMTVLETADDDYDVITYLWRLENIDYTKVVDKLVELDKTSTIFYLLEEYGHKEELKDFNYNRLALKLIEKTDPYAIYSNIKKFKKLNKEVFRKLLVLDNELFGWLVNGLEAGVFKTSYYDEEEGLEADDYNRLALKMLEDGYDGAYSLSISLEHFFYLNEKVARKLIENNYAKKVDENREAFDKNVNLDELLKEAA